MANIVFNIAKGRVVEYYNRVENNDPAVSAFILVVTWTAASGNAISKILVCYDADTGAGTDSAIIPLTMFDFAQTPSGSDIQMTTGVFFRAS